MSALTIVFDWIAIPLAAAGGVVLTRWGADNLVYEFALPILVLLWRMYVLSARRPNVPREDRCARHRAANWHALSIAACLFLMVFEAGVPALAEARVRSVASWFLFTACTYLPFVLISVLAERFLPQRAPGTSPN